MSQGAPKDLLAESSTEKSPERIIGDLIGQTLAAREAAPPRPARLPWYRQAFQADYLDLYLHRDLAEAAHAVRFLARALTLDRTQRLLDLCCGPGRHLAFLGAHVKEAVGLDLSRALLTRAREHWTAAFPLDGTAAGPGHEKVSAGMLIQGDMRHLPLPPGAFDRVVNLFTSFGYFEREEDNAAVLGEIARILRPGGLLALDHINREAMLAHLRPQTERVLPDGRHLVEKRRFDGASQRVIKDVICSEPGGQVKAWCESVRVYVPDELETLLAAAGLAPLTRHGDYDGGPWRPDAPRLILIAFRT